QHVHRRRLPGAVRPEEAVDLALRHVEVDPRDRAYAVLELADETLGLDALRSHSSTLPAGPAAAVHAGFRGGCVPQRTVAHCRDAYAERVRHARRLPLLAMLVLAACGGGGSKTVATRTTPTA